MKKLFWSLFILALPCWGAFTFVQTPPAMQISHSGARVLMSTSQVTTAAVVWDTVSHCAANSNCTAHEYGAACTGYTGGPDGPLGSATSGSNTAAHGWFIGGAPANATIFWAWSVSDNGGGCSMEQSFTTSPLPIPHPAVAALPGSLGNAITTPPTPPTQTGTTWLVGTNCTNLVSCWQAASCGDTIQVPAGSTPNPGAVGYFQMIPAKTCTQTSQLLIETTAVNSLPPVGVRVDPITYPGYKSALATVEGSAFFHYRPQGLGGLGETTGADAAPDNGNCYPGAYVWALPGIEGGTPGFLMQQCQANSPVVITSITGCNAGALFTGCLVTTASAHGFSAANGGDHIEVQGVVGIDKANGTCQVESIVSSTQFTMGCAGGYQDFTNTYVSGGAVQNHSWHTITPQAVSLSALPSSCSPIGAWGYDSSAATANYFAQPWPNNSSIFGGQNISTAAIVRCVTAENGSGNGVWRTWTVLLEDPHSTDCCAGFFGGSIEGQISPAAIDLSGSTWVYVRGLHLTNVPIPYEPLFVREGGQPTANVDFQGGKMAQPYVVTSVPDSFHGSTSNHITLDQVWVDCPDYDNHNNFGAIQSPLILNGNNIALINSYIGPGCSDWVEAADRGSRYDNFAEAPILRSAGQGFLMYNNYCQCDGIGMHNDDQETLVLQNQDITTQRNTFYRTPAHFYGHPLSNGVYYPLRQLHEFKQGQRVLITGNQFINNFRNVSQAAALAVTPRAESSPFGFLLPTVSSSGGTTTLSWANIPNANLNNGSWLWCAPNASVSGGGVTNLAVSSNVGTVTTPQPHGMVVGQTVSITSSGTVALDHQYVVASVPSATTFTVATSGVANGTYTDVTVSSVDILVQLNGSTASNNGTTTQAMLNGFYYCARADWPYGVQDMTISYNLFQSLPDVVSMFPETNIDVTTPNPAITAPLARLTMHDNVSNGILDDTVQNFSGTGFTNGTSGDPYIWQGSGGGFKLYDAWPFAQDYIVNHETDFSIGGRVDDVFSSGSYVTPTPFLKNNEGIYVTNNLSSIRAASTCLVPANCVNNSPITDGLGASGSNMLTRCCVNSLLGNNLFQYLGTNPGGYPSSITWAPSVAALGLRNAIVNQGFVPLTPIQADLGLQYNSPGISGNHLALDGLDAGANWNALQAALGTVSNVRVMSISSSGATVAFFAPDTFGCAVDYGTDPNFGPGNYVRATNVGGSRGQSVTLTGLATKTMYYYRLNCQTQQPRGNFSTH